jgi:shikimate kinase
MNIVLIGYRGTGKSAVGALLADRLGMACVSMDAEIVLKAGIPIPEIVANEGWPGFRDRESALARELGERDGLVIDTGGGVIERPENIAALGKNGCIVWLKAKVSTIVARIEGDTGRPPLTAGKSFTDEVAEVLDRRTPLYRAAAHGEIDTNELTPTQIADRIFDIFEQKRRRQLGEQGVCSEGN